MIQSEFKGRPGGSLVRQKLFHILNADGLVITGQNWTETVSPGSSLAVRRACSFPYSKSVVTSGFFTVRIFGQAILTLSLTDVNDVEEFANP
jgi:hypothetical protein